LRHKYTYVNPIVANYLINE